MNRELFDFWMKSLTAGFSKRLDEDENLHWFNTVKDSDENPFIETMTRLANGQYFPTFKDYKTVYRQVVSEEAKHGRPWESEYGCADCRDGYLHVMKGIRERNLGYLNRDHDDQEGDYQVLLLCKNCFPEKPGAADPKRKWKFEKGLEPWNHLDGVEVPRSENIQMVKELNLMIQQPKGVVNWVTEEKKKLVYHQRSVKCFHESGSLTESDSKRIRKEIDVSFGTWKNQYDIPF